MNHARKRFLILCFCCLFTQTILCNTQNINRNSEEFLSKLRSNIKIFKRYVEGEKPVEFTLLRVAGNDINMTEFCKLNQRLCGRDEPEKQICIITLRNTHKSDTCDADNLMVKLIRCLQIHLNQNGNTVLLNEVGVSIDHIKEAYIADYDKITKTTDDFFGKHEKLEEMIIDNIYWISCDAIVVILHDIIFSSLYRIENLDDIYKRLRNGSFKVISQEVLYKMIQILVGIIQKGNATDKVDIRFWSKCSTFDILYRVICTYEKTNRIDTFSSGSSKFQNVYFYLLKIKYSKLIEKSIEHLLKSICKIFGNLDNVKRFEEYFAPLCYEYIRKQNGTSYSAPWTTKYEDKRSLFYSNKLFLDKTENFLKELLTDDMMRIHGKTMQPMIKRLRQKQSEENVTRIFYDKKLTRKTVYQLCSILQNSNGLSDFHKHQLIYINSGKEILKGEEHTLIDQCDSILSDCNSFDSVEEIKSTVQILNESTKPTACQMFTYTRRNVAGKVETIANYSDLTKLANTNIITIDKYTEPMGDTARKEYIEKCIKSCIDDAKSIIFDSWVITVTSEHNQSLIYMITYGKNDVSDERVLLIFDVPFADRPANCLDFSHSDRYIRCIDDAKEPVLHNLNDNLKALQLAACTKLHIPNVSYALDYDHTYTEKIFTKTGFNSPKEFVYDYIRSTQMTHDIHMLCDNIPIESVLNYEEKRFCYTLQLFNFFNKLGIDLYCFESYLFELISKRAYSGCVDNESTTKDEYNRNCKIDICYTLQADNSATLHIIKETKMSFKDSAINNPTTLLCKMLEYQEFSCLLKALDLTQSYNCKTTFLTSLIDAVCTRILNTSGIACSGEFYIKDDACEKIISECIENHRKGILNSSITSNGKYTEPSRLYQQAFDKLIDHEDIRDLAKTIVQELKTLSNTRLITIKSIKLDTGSLRSQKLDVLSSLKKNKVH